MLPPALKLRVQQVPLEDDTYIQSVQNTYVTNARRKVCMDQCSSMFTELRYTKRKRNDRYSSPA